MSNLGTRESACQRLVGNGRANRMTQHEYLDALEEALIALRSFGADDSWREVGRAELLRRLLDARRIAEAGEYEWAAYKKALGLTG